MAKKKTSDSKADAEKSPPAKKTAAKKTAASASSTAASRQTRTKSKPTSAPMIDTSLAAEAAARMLLNRRQPEPGERKGGLIQQLKADLNKGGSQSVSSMLDKSATPGQKRPNLPFGGQKQVGHNQTFGPDVARSGVPRRTSG